LPVVAYERCHVIFTVQGVAPSINGPDGTIRTRLARQHYSRKPIQRRRPWKAGYGITRIGDVNSTEQRSFYMLKIYTVLATTWYLYRLPKNEQAAIRLVPHLCRDLCFAGTPLSGLCAAIAPGCGRQSVVWSLPGHHAKDRPHDC